MLSILEFVRIMCYYTVLCRLYSKKGLGNDYEEFDNRYKTVNKVNVPKRGASFEYCSLFVKPRFLYISNSERHTGFPLDVGIQRRIKA